MKKGEIMNYKLILYFYDTDRKPEEIVGVKKIEIDEYDLKLTFYDGREQLFDMDYLLKFEVQF
jgi:hypothetical protein